MKCHNIQILSKKFLIVFIYLFLSTAAFAIQGYNAIDLGTIEGKFVKVTPNAINEIGQVVGLGYWSDSEGKLHSSGFIWDNLNGMKSIEGLGGNSTIHDINDLGQAVGYSGYPNGDRQAFLWENNVIFDLGIGWAVGINNLGVVVGGSSSGAFMWDKINGRTNPFGNGDIRPAEINDLGQVTGTASNPSGYLQAFIWDVVNGFKFIDMPSDLQASVGVDINNFSQIAGHGDSKYEPHYHHSYIWEGTNVISTLGDLGGNQEWASGINNLGQIVGNATAPDFMQYGCGFIWDEINGIRNINDILLYKEGLEYISSAVDINDFEMIIGRGIIDEENGIYHAFLLIPLKAPTFSCTGFEPPCDDIITVKNKNRCVPLRTELRDADGVPITDADIQSLPIIEVSYESNMPSPSDTTVIDGLPPSVATDGNEFVFEDGKWHLNVKIRDYCKEPGTYTFTMKSGDEGEYLIESANNTVTVIVVK